MSGFIEDHLVEQPAIQLMRDELDWEVVNAFGEWSGGVSSLGREAKREVVLVERLEAALRKLNPEFPGVALAVALEVLTADRSALSLVEANREIDKLVRNGVKVVFPDREVGGQRTEVVRVIDWNEAEVNDFLLVSQFWVSGETYTRRMDLVGFVNGLPLVLMELKKPGAKVREAYDKNLADYKKNVAQIFHYIGFLLVSNGVTSKIGSVTSEWEHFGDWKKVADEDEAPELALEVLLRGTCEKGRLLDLVENFVRFVDGKKVGKLVARNHQFLGVNRTVDSLDVASDGRLGVFWHTQGSGKSYSMMFFAEKVFRKVTGNWTFVVVTDRKELDQQIYRTFADCGAAGEHCQAKKVDDLRRLLTEDHRYVFTLIHKFRTDPGARHPVLSERDDIVVLTDEAHRSQDDTLAMNLRTALPNAKFVAFTGTPLIAGEERTREVFGDYVSIYDFKQSVDDGATVPLFYENRTPELEIASEELNEEIYRVIDESGLDDAQEEKLHKVLGQRYHLITREDRLDKVAKDIVHHFLNRGYQGKAMVVSIDKLTALRMYEKVSAEWEAERERVLEEMKVVHAGGKEFAGLNERLRILNRVEKAVVVSPGQNEVGEMEERGIDIRPHRELMMKEDLEERFQNPDDPFSLVFVCAMWLTGFDAPSCSTLYLDKPMRGHTLMQTIARVNRTHGEKANGLVVDYANVFQELEKALAIYGVGQGGESMPVKDKSELVKALQIAIEETREFCRRENVELEGVVTEGWKNFLPAVNQLVRTDGVKDEFLANTREVERLYKAVMPDPMISELAPVAQVIAELAQAVWSNSESPNILAVMGEIGGVLNDGIVAASNLKPGEKVQTIDLSEVDFEVLKKKFARSTSRNIQVQQLRALIEQKLDKLIRLNATRYDFLDRFQKMVEDYNNGALSIEVLFDELVTLSQELNEEEQRHVRESVSEEQLAVFDILTRPGPVLDPREVESIKKVSKELLAKLKTELLVLAWRKKRTTRAAVRVEIEKMLDDGLPEKYTTELFEEKCRVLFQHVLEKYPDEGASAYLA